MWLRPRTPRVSRAERGRQLPVLGSRAAGHKDGVIELQHDRRAEIALYIAIRIIAARKILRGQRAHTQYSDIFTTGQWHFREDLGPGVDRIAREGRIRVTTAVYRRNA